MLMLVRPLAFVGALVAGVAGVTAQSSPSRTGLTLQGPAEGGNIIKNALGRPCLDVEAAAVPHVVDRQVLDHVVSLKNNCPRVIKAKVCYFNSQKCNELTVLAYKRLDTVIGTMRGVSVFRYSIEQK
jgi:hypothetical protein